MTTEQPINDPQQLIAAFADGELTGEQNLQLMKLMADDPGITQQVADQQKLRQAVARAMTDESIQTPAHLRDQIMQMSIDDTPASHTETTPTARPQTGSSVLAVIGRWAPAAVAAVLLIGALVALNLADNVGGSKLITSAKVLNASLVNEFGNRHFKCARHLTPMHGTDKFPQDLDALPGALSSYFQQPIDENALNLSALGFEFDMAGLCLLPGKGSVHVVYKSQAPTGQIDTLSLWLRPYDDQSTIEPGRLYKTADATDNFPMLVWRQGDMVYYLVGDSYDTVERAFDAISKNQG